MTVTILEGDVRAMLRTLPAESINCIWTSIPYWGLRSYGTVPQIWGGDDGCEHEWLDATVIDSRHLPEATPSPKQGTNKGSIDRGVRPGDRCRLCGAWRGEHGLEPTLEMWLQNEVVIWRELRRVLRKDGVAWLNCGDAYATSSNGRSAADAKALGNDDRTFRDKPISTVGRPNKGNTGGDSANDAYDTTEWKKHGTGLASKQRLMLPARVALALQSDGWWLRDEIVWFKANPMPSSVQDRTTPAHEMLYMLTRSARYYYDNKAIMEPMADSSVARLAQPSIDKQMGGAKQDMYEAAGINLKSGSRRPNQIVQSLAKKQGKNEEGEFPSASARTRTGFNDRWDAGEAHKRLNDQSETLVAGNKWGARHEGWAATKDERTGRNKRSVWPLATEPFPDAHFATAPTALVEPCLKAGCPAGGTVLDPFFGSGTTGLVADRLRLNCIGIELNPEYAKIARARLQADAGLFSDVQTVKAAD